MSKPCEQHDALNIERKYRRRAERRCFWTRPIGHCIHWQYVHGTLDKIGECCHCGKTKISICPIQPRRTKANP